MDFKKEYLDEHFPRVSPKDFYREIFPKGELQAEGETGNLKYNAIAVELFPDEPSKRNKRYTIKDDLSMLDELLAKDSFIILAPISYVGKARSAKNARYIYALAIDLDGVTKVGYVVDLFHQAQTTHRIPNPTYVVNSGNGFHLYYVFEQPVACFESVVKQLHRLKKELTRLVWHMFLTSLSRKVQYQSIHQGFRMVGGTTKNGRRVEAYRTGDKVTIGYLNSFVKQEFRATELTYKSDLPLREAKQKYPDWYERRIVKKQKPKRWVNKRALYDWWKERLIGEIQEGHRYYGVSALAIYAKKCDIDYEELERDALGLVDILDEDTQDENNHFTKADALAALKMYHEDFVNYPREKIAETTGLLILPNKRNFRSQADHIRIMNAIREIEYPDGSWRNDKGRPSKEKEVIGYIQENPNKNPTEIARDLGVSRPTVYKYLRKIKGILEEPTEDIFMVKSPVEVQRAFEKSEESIEGN